ncbi:hypothetical protein LTS18_008423, partial [Coniosporium uncinatum]
MSEELGEEDAYNRVNSRTGRPIRRSAGRKSFDPEFVNSQMAIDEVAEEFHEEVKEPGESDNDDGELGDDAEVIKKIGGRVKRGRKQKRQTKKKKRPRSPSPPLSTHEDENFSRESTPEHELQEAESNASHANKDSAMSDASGSFTINLTVNIPKDYAGGPITLTLPSEVLKQGQKRQKVEHSNESTIVLGGAKHAGNTPRPPLSGWHSLSAELRNKIYRLLFVTEERVAFDSLLNLKRSAAFLATCRQVYDEGRTILYMENKFHFERNKHPRNPYWSTKTEEVGWKD